MSRWTTRHGCSIAVALGLVLSALGLPGAAIAQGDDPWTRIWQLVPPQLPGTCESLSYQAGDTVVPSVAALSCLETDGPEKVEDVGLYLFDDLEQLRSWWDERTRRIAKDTGVPLGPGDCQHNVQGIEETASGEVICYKQSGDARVRWIDETTLLYGSVDTDWGRIPWAYDWWSKNLAPVAVGAPAETSPPQVEGVRVAGGDASPLSERAFTSTWIGDGPDDHSTRLTANVVDGATGYRWDIDGDGAWDLEGQSVEHLFDAPGERHITLTAEFADGTERSRTMRVAVNPAVTFAPLVYLHPDEAYWPMSAEAFIANSRLNFGHDEACRPTSPLDWRSVDATRLGDGGYAGQLADDGDCRPYGDAYTSAQLTRPFDNVFPADEAGEGFYLDLDDDWYPGMPVGRAPAYYEYEPGAYLIYWFLSGYNEHRDGPTDRASIGNTHEGDWEHIAIRLDEVDQATLFAYYQHDCASVVFNRLEMGGGFGTDTELVDGTHPVVYSALGSHASYWQPIDQGVIGTVSGLLRERLSQITGTEGEEMCWRKDTASAGVPWRTWEDLADARAADWYGYGGGWGVLGKAAISAGPVESGPRWNDGPLGPSEYLLARATPGWTTRGGAIDPALPLAPEDPPKPRPWGATLCSIEDVDIDGAGNVFVLDNSAGCKETMGDYVGRVTRWSPAGEKLASWGGKGSKRGRFERPSSLAVSARGDVYVRDVERIQRFTSDGEFVGQWRAPGYGGGIAVDASGNLLAVHADAMELVVYSPDGQVVNSLRSDSWIEQQSSDGSASTTSPVDVSVAPNGDVFVVAESNGRYPSDCGDSLSACYFHEDRIYRFTPDGRELASWRVPQGRRDDQVTSIAAAGSGLIVVTSSVGPIYLFDPAGESLGVWGTSDYLDGLGGNQWRPWLYKNGVLHLSWTDAAAFGPSSDLFVAVTDTLLHFPTGSAGEGADSPGSQGTMGPTDSPESVALAEYKLSFTHGSMDELWDLHCEDESPMFVNQWGSAIDEIEFDVAAEVTSRSSNRALVRITGRVWFRLTDGRSDTADPDFEYPVVLEDGAWKVCVVSMYPR